MSGLSKLRRRLNDSGLFWPDAELQEWLDEGAAEIARRTETLQTIGAVSVPPGTGEVPLPPDLLRLHLVLIQTRPGYARRLNYVDGVASQRNSSPLLFTVWGTPPQLTVWPTPVENEQLYCLYYQTGQNPPTGWDDILVDYAEYHALRKDRDPRWSESRALFESKINHMIDTTRRWTDAAGQIVEDISGEFPFVSPIAAGEGWDVARWDEGHWQ